MVGIYLLITGILRISLYAVRRYPALEHKLEEFKSLVKDRVMSSLDFSREITDQEMFEIIDREISAEMRHRMVTL